MELFSKLIEENYNLEKYIPLAAQKSIEVPEYWKTHKVIVKNNRYHIPCEAHFLKEENIAVSFHVIGTIFDTIQDTSWFNYFHHHDFYEINYIYHGEVINYLPDQVIRQKIQSDSFNEPMVYHRPVIQSKDTVLFNILIRKELSSDILYHDVSSNLVHAFLDSSLGLSPLQPYLSFDNTPEITLLIHQMIQEYYDHKPYCQQILYSELMKLWSLFARQKDKQLQKESQKQEYPEERCKYYLI